MADQGGAGLARLLAPVDQSNRDSVSVEITRKLLDYLMSGHVHPGQRLPPERQLSRALGVGRSIVREALKSLTLLGLVEVRPGDGTYVKAADSPLLSPSIEWGLVLGGRDMEDLVELRTELEASVAGLAARRRDESTVAELRALLARMTAAGADDGAREAAQAALDARVAAAARNEVLAAILSTARSLLQGRMARAGSSTHDPAADALVDDYRLLVDAIAGQDADAASAVATRKADREASRLRGATGEPGADVPDQGDRDGDGKPSQRVRRGRT